MTKNGAPGGGRIGQVTGRSQVFNRSTGHWTKRDTAIGQFLGAMTDGTPFTGVRKDKGEDRAQ